MRPNPWELALGSLLLACATTGAPTSKQQPAPVVSSDEQLSNLQHPDTPSRKRGLIVPSDVSMPGSDAPVPAVTQTASPGIAPASGSGN